MHSGAAQEGGPSATGRGHQPVTTRNRARGVCDSGTSQRTGPDRSWSAGYLSLPPPGADGRGGGALSRPGRPVAGRRAVVSRRTGIGGSASILSTASRAYSADRQGGKERELHQGKRPDAVANPMSWANGETDPVPGAAAPERGAMATDAQRAFQVRPVRVSRFFVGLIAAILVAGSLPGAASAVAAKTVILSKVDSVGAGTRSLFQGISGSGCVVTTGVLTAAKFDQLSGPAPGVWGRDRTELHGFIEVRNVCSGAVLLTAEVHESLPEEAFTIDALNLDSASLIWNVQGFSVDVSWQGFGETERFHDNFHSIYPDPRYSLLEDAYYRAADVTVSVTDSDGVSVGTATAADGYLTRSHFVYINVVGAP